MKTKLTEYCIRISKIEDLALWSVMYNNLPMFTFDGSKKRNDAKMSKGLCYVLFLRDYFDIEKNKALYKGSKTSPQLYRSQ